MILKHPKRASFQLPIYSPASSITKPNVLNVFGTTLFIPIDSLDANVAHALRKLLFAYMVIRTRVYLPKDHQNVDRVILMVAQRQSRRIWAGGGRKWQKGALRLILGRIGGVKEILVVGGKVLTRLTQKSVWDSLIGELRKDDGLMRRLDNLFGGSGIGSKWSGVLFERAVVMGVYDTRMSAPDRVKGLVGKDDEESKGSLAQEVVSLHEELYDKRWRKNSGTIVYIRRSKSNRKRLMKSKKMEKKLMEALERAGKTRPNGIAAPLKILEDKVFMSFKTQMKLMKDADVVVGVHGAGLANIILTRPNTTLIEIMPYKFNHPMYESSKQGGTRYVKVNILRGGEYKKLKGLNGTAPTYAQCIRDEARKCKDFYKNQKVQLGGEDISKIEEAVVEALK